MHALCLWQALTNACVFQLEEVHPAFQALPREEFLQTLIRPEMRRTPAESHVVRSADRRMQVLAAPRKKPKPPKKKAKPAQAPQAVPAAEAEAPEVRRSERIRASLLKTVDGRRKLDAAPAVASSEEEEDEDDDGVIAQIKLDGDRLQAHLMLDGTVRLFTKSGFDASDLYSDIRHALAGAAGRLAPCILDGELVVVGANGVPLPWVSEKWRYNNTGAQSMEEWAKEDENDGVLMLEYDESENAGMNGWDDTSDLVAHYDDSAMTFLPMSAAANVAGHRRARRVGADGAHLRFFLFDVLLCQGELWAKHGYARRLRHLNTVVRAALGLEAHGVQVIPHGNRRVHTTKELVELVREGVGKQLEVCASPLYAIVRHCTIHTFLKG